MMSIVSQGRSRLWLKANEGKEDKQDEEERRKKRLRLRVEEK